MFTIAIPTTQDLTLGVRLRLWIDGYLAGTVRAGLGFDANTKDVDVPVYSQVDSIIASRLASGPQSFEIVENSNLEIINKVIAGFDPNVDTEPIVAGVSPTIKKHVLFTETLNEDMDGYEGTSQFIGNFRGKLGGPKGTPDGELVRTISGTADAPKESLAGGQFTAKRVSLTSYGSDVRGSWSSPIPLVLTDFGASLYAAYLEVQLAGTSRTFKANQVTVDTSNVTVSGNGGKVIIPHADVITANLGGNATHAWVVILHAAAGSLVTADGKYG